MRSFVCAVYDMAIAAYMPPFVAPALGAAVRSFQDEVNRGGDSVMSKHPKDYRLYHVAMFDSDSGEFEQLKPVIIADGSQMVMEV